MQIVEGNEARIETLQHSLSEEAKARRKTAAFAIASVAVAVQGGAADVTTIGATLGWNAAKIGWAMEQIGPVGEVLRPIVESLKLIWPNIRFPF